MKERKKVSGVEKYSAWLHFTSVDSASFAGRWYMYGRFDVMDLGRLFDGVAGMQPLDALSEDDGKLLPHKHGFR